MSPNFQNLFPYESKVQYFYTPVNCLVKVNIKFKNRQENVKKSFSFRNVNIRIVLRGETSNRFLFPDQHKKNCNDFYKIIVLQSLYF